jgi:hypothetical protein
MRTFWDRAAHVQIETVFLIEYVKMLRAMKTFQRRRMIEARLKVDPDFAAVYQRAGEREMSGHPLSRH